jgi:hypothetical protein
MRCSMCGHESPTGSSFCLNCGSSLSQAVAQTPSAAPGLPGLCVVCRGENPPGMKFCRSCGSALPVTSPGAPAFGTPVGRPRAGPTPSPLGAAMSGIPSGPIGAQTPPPVGVPAYGPLGGLPGMNTRPADPTVPPSMPPSPSPVSPALAPTGIAPGPSRAAPGTIACPRCGTQTPVGFAYCQQCGLHMQGLQPTDPGANARPRTPSSAPLGLRDAPIDPHAGTLAQDEGHAPTMVPSRPSPSPLPAPPLPAAPARVQVGAAWGTAVLVNRDGSDGQRFPLSGEYVVVGRSGADIAFDEDRFLARQHARIELGADGSVTIHPLDNLNGVFRKSDAPVDLVDGTTVLVGREVLRYERVDPDEVKLHPLVRHGVALFGSPPREPWGRLVQLVPSGGYRDVRHLAGDEIVLGREEGDIVFRDDAFLSRRHAAVTWDGKRAQLTDLGSSNGTFVRVAGPTALKHGDHVRMGDQLLRIELGR